MMRPVRWKNHRLLTLVLGIVFILLFYKIFLADNDDPDAIDSFKLPQNSFAVVDITRAEKLLSEISWPTFQGYDNKYANERDNPEDRSLFERLRISQEYFLSPTFHLKGVRREKGKFEKIVHLTWKSDNIPERTGMWVQTWLEQNPGWTIMFWTDKTQDDFIKLHFPRLHDAYNSWTFPVQKADMFRYIALYAFGGVYADLDVENLRPLEDIRSWSSCILSREPDPQVFVLYPPLASWSNNWTFTCNAFMACKSHHPFLLYHISRIVQNSPLMRNSPCPLEKTILCSGPWMLSFSYTFYRRSIREERRKALSDWDVICPNYKYFLPTYDPSRRNKLKRTCLWMQFFGTSRQRQICREESERNYRNKREKYSFTNHRWFSSYHNWFKRYVNVTDVTNVTSWRSDKFEICRSERCREID